MRRPLTLPLLVLASALASSALAAPVVLNVAEDGWSAVASNGFPSNVMSGTEAVSGKIKLFTVPDGARIFAYNGTSNLAEIGAPGDLARTTIGREGATHLFQMSVRVVEGLGEGAKAYTREASVELKDGDRTQSLITSDGTATFWWAKLGDATITVKSRGEDNKVRTTVQKVALERDGLSGFVVPVTDTPAPATGGASGTASSGTAPASPPAPTPTATSTAGAILGNLLSLLIGLGVVGGLAYAAWRYARANPERVSDALGKIGADVPKPLDPDDPPSATPSATPAPAPLPSGPIVLDPVPAPIAVAPAPISLTPTPTGVPRLIGSDGSAFELPEGETVVGREALGGLMISHDTVSRRHARLVRSGPSVAVEDLGSTNGTWVNDAPAPASLQGGESVRFGQVAYRYEA